MSKRQSFDVSSDSSQPMSLEDARSVLWLRNNHRPLGELLDSGFLNEERLEWAARKAYNPQLKQAAGVLLEWVRQASKPQFPSPAKEEPPPVDAGITTEQARATPWPFKPFRGQAMGSLVDTRQLSLKNLAYAIENAWDERVRRAAVVLTALRLKQVVTEPAPPAGPLRVISSGKSYSEREELRWTSIQGFLYGVLFVLWIGGLIWLIRSLPSQAHVLVSYDSWTPIGIAVVIILAVLSLGLGWLAVRLMGLGLDRVEWRIENYQKGQEGEDRVVEAMRQNLDGQWTLFCNVVLPGRSKADIDAVLVGPPGVWGLEVKTLTGEFRNIGEQWEYRAGNRWELLKQSPSRQAQGNAARLSAFFRADGIRQWVSPAIIWANRESFLSVENPSVAVWTLDHLPEELGNIWRGQDMPESNHTRIVEKLMLLCEKQGDT